MMVNLGINVISKANSLSYANTNMLVSNCKLLGLLPLLFWKFFVKNFAEEGKVNKFQLSEQWLVENQL